MAKLQNIPDIELKSLSELIYDIADDDRELIDTNYHFNNMKVPRVTRILNSTLPNDEMMNLMKSVGGNKFDSIMEKACDVGNLAHKSIEEFLITGKEFEFSSMETISLPGAVKAYTNFKCWIYNLNKMGFKIEEIIDIEKSISCPYYGGTIDAILKINGKNYIVDFKTTKDITYKHILQICSYMWIVNNGFHPELPHIDGVGIIRLSKKSVGFNDLFLNEHIPEQMEIIKSFHNGFWALLHSYYNNINMKHLFTQYGKVYNFRDTVK